MLFSSDFANIFKFSTSLHPYKHFPFIYLILTYLFYSFLIQYASSIFNSTIHYFHDSYPLVGIYFSNVGFSSLIHILTWQTYGAVQYFIFDRNSQIKLWTQYKLHRKDTITYYQMWPRTIYFQFLLFPLCALVSMYISFRYLNQRGFHSVYPEVPNILIILLEAILNYLVYEIWFYFSHRYSHYNKEFYLKYHLMHHLTKGSVGISGLYMSTIDFIFTQAIPLLLGQLLINYHPISICLSTFVGSMNSIHSHGGYNFPLMPDCNDHNLHHALYNCNYGTGICDDLFGTAIKKSDNKTTSHRTPNSHNE